MAGESNAAAEKGLQGFMRGRQLVENGHQFSHRPSNASGLFEDVRMNTKIPKAERSKKRAPRSDHVDRDYPETSQPHASGPAFYDTDASAADDISTYSVKSADCYPPRATYVATMHAPPNHEIDAGNDTEEDRSEEDAHGVANERGPKLNDRQYARMRQHEQEGTGSRFMSITRPMPGDSLPDDTSGRLSSKHLAEERSEIDMRHHQVHTGSRHQHDTQLQMQLPQKKISQPQQRTTGTQASSSKRSEEMRENGFIARPAEPENCTQFFYGRAQKQSFSTHNHSLAVRQSGDRELPYAASSTLAHRASVATVSQVATQAPVPEHPQTKQMMVAVLGGNPETQQGRRRSLPNPRPMIERQSSREDEPVSNIKHEQTSQEQAPVKVDSSVDEHEEVANDYGLDYEEETLFHLSYEDLKSQPFDTDPRGSTFVLPDEMEHSTLEHKVAAVAKMRPRDQADFFGSLSIDEWEQAGDWFITRFSGILEQLKQTRREKRQAAREIENEIESRHGIIGKKRKQTDDALEEMKISGGKILDATPKRTKKT